MNEQAFLDWLDEIDDYYVSDERVRDEWPEFHEQYNLFGVTCRVGDDGETLVPKTDYRDVVLRGHALD